MAEKIALGSRVRDLTTGVEGTVTGRAEYLHNPPALRVEGRDVNGRPIDFWETESRFEVVK